MFRLINVAVSAALLLLVACGSSSSQDKVQTGPLAAPAVTATCTMPKQGLLMATLSPKTSCPWWTQTDTKESLRLTGDYVQYPFSDDTCGTIVWSGCTVRNDDCSPMKLDAGDQGYFAKASMVATYTDDRHVVGTVRLDVGQPCIMEIDFTAEPLFK